jgi:hypothetical protein
VHALAREQAIRERAYRIWENEGCFHGKHIEHWLCAESEISEDYLLDTSAFINLGLPVFTNLRYWHLHVCPYVFWERLCHLDEKTDFPRAKGEFKKFKYVRVLDDPRATIEKPEGRVSDTELISGALDALNASVSLGDFYSKQIHDSNNNAYQIAGCVDVARNELKRREDRYVAFITQIMGMFTSGQITRMTDEVKHKNILALAMGWVGVAEVKLIYLYFGYMFHRAFQFLESGKTMPAKADYNDYEDSNMCLHLRLDGSYCFVTDDRGAQRALEETVALLGRINDPQFRTTLKVRRAEHLRHL